MRVGVYYSMADGFGKLAVRLADELKSHGLEVSTYSENVKVSSKQRDHRHCCSRLGWMLAQDKLVLFGMPAIVEKINRLVDMETILVSRPYRHHEVRYSQQASRVVTTLGQWDDELKNFGCRSNHIPYASPFRMHRGKALSPKVTVTMVLDSGSIDLYEALRICHFLISEMNVQMNVFRPSRVPSHLYRFMRALERMGAVVIDSRRQYHYRRLMTYSQSDLVVWPALSDTCEIVPIDAESCGTRVVLYENTAAMCELPVSDSFIRVKAPFDERYFRHAVDPDRNLLKRTIQEVDTLWRANSPSVSSSRSESEMMEKWLHVIL